VDEPEQEQNTDPAAAPVRELKFHQPLDEDTRAALFAKFHSE
jgi:hypothetical protein